MTDAEFRDKLENDFSFYCHHLYKIIDEDSKLVPLTFNLEQTLLHVVIDWFKKLGVPVKIWILKPRKRGVTTVIQARLLHRASTRKYQSTVCVSHDPSTTGSIFEIAKRFYDHLPRAIKPGKKRDNVKLLEFNNDEGTGLDSSYCVAAAGSKNFGSGQTFNLIHLSELPKWERNLQEPLLTSIFCAASRSVDTEIYIEATAQGVGDAFHKGFMGAKYRFWVRNKNFNEPEMFSSVNPSALPGDRSASVFFPWYITEKHKKKAPPGFERTPEEDELRNRYFISDENLVWRRWAIAEPCRGSKDIFDQEYPTTAKGAFLSTGRPVFDNKSIADKIEVLEKRLQALPPKRFEVLLPSGTMVENRRGELKVYEMPKPGNSYIVFADVAEGLNHGDFDSVDVIDHHSGKQVAKWYGKVRPYQLGDTIMSIGRFYNNALLAPEKNNAGISVIDRIVEAGYPDIYVEMVPDPPHRSRKRYGWVTSEPSRRMMLDHAVSLMANGHDGISDIGTLEEMLCFKYNNGRPEAESGQHDDQVISWAGAQIVKHLIPAPKQRSLEDHANLGMNYSSYHGKYRCQDLGGIFSA